jgi:hypothetical protein
MTFLYRVEGTIMLVFPVHISSGCDLSPLTRATICGESEGRHVGYIFLYARVHTIESLEGLFISTRESQDQQKSKLREEVK